ncbi:MAG: IS1 family transposase, partial [Candidatus Caenarcaniphilales bacterium]|nr:IS1 family transposase [Candidatus Caenarcaniphilales bacterium]
PVKYLASKAYTSTMESVNSQFRQYLARLDRRSKFLSKSIDMLKLSLKVLIHKLNLRLLP